MYTRAVVDHVGNPASSLWNSSFQLA